MRSVHFVVGCRVGGATVALFSFVIGGLSKGGTLQHSTTVLTGSPLSPCQICVVIAAVFGIVIYRVVTVSTFAAFKWALIRNNSQVATTGTAVCINFCIIMLLNVVSGCRVTRQRHRVCAPRWGVSSVAKGTWSQRGPEH